VLSPFDLAELESAAAAAALESVEDGDATLAVLGDPRIAHSGALRGLALFALHHRLAHLARDIDKLDAIDALLAQARAASLPVGGAAIAHKLGRALADRIAEMAPEQWTPHAIALLARATTRARELAPDVNLWRAQEAYVQFVRNFRGEGEARAAFDALGDSLGVRLADPVR